MKSSWLRNTLHKFAVYMAIGLAAVPFGILFAIWKIHGHIAPSTLALAGSCLLNTFSFLVVFRYRHVPDVLTTDNDQETVNVTPMRMRPSDLISAAASGSGPHIEVIRYPAHMHE